MKEIRYPSSIRERWHVYHVPPLSEQRKPFGLRLKSLCGGTQHTHRDSALASYLVSCHARQTP